MNLANLITLGRLLAVPLVVWLILSRDYTLTFWLFAAASVSDAIDGYVAKHFNQRSDLGALLDPIADKTLIVSLFITLGLAGDLPTWLVILVVFRDLCLMAATLLAKFTESRVDISPSLLGKGTTVFQLLYIVLVVILTSRHMDLHLIQPLLYLVVGFTILSGLHYLYRGITRVSPNQV